MSVTGMVGGSYVDFDVSIGDWGALCRWLSEHSDEPAVNVFGSVSISNWDNSAQEVHRAIAAARALNPPEYLDIIINTIEHNCSTLIATSPTTISTFPKTTAHQKARPTRLSPPGPG